MSYPKKPLHLAAAAALYFSSSLFVLQGRRKYSAARMHHLQGPCFNHLLLHEAGAFLISNIKD
jgi:hypothetical protein